MTKVLIVDDDDDIRTILQEALQHEGFHCEVARNGQECLNFLSLLDEEGWVVLLDVDMPTMTGPEAVQELRNNPGWLDGHKVVMMSAGRQIGLMPHVLKDVVVAFVPKPFHLEHLLRLLQELGAEEERGSRVLSRQHSTRC